MSTDSQSQETLRPIPDGWQLPRITGIEIRRTRYEPAKYRFIQSAYSAYREAVELLVSYEGEFPVSRALSPILYVGEVPVGESKLLEGNQARFLAFQPEQLEEGAPIFVGWPGQPELRKETGFRYQLKG
jgi:hypothetical protein